MAIGVSAIKVEEWAFPLFYSSVEDVVNKLGFDELSFRRISYVSCASLLVFHKGFRLYVMFWTL